MHVIFTRDQRGFSLLEVVIAGAILAAAVLTLAQLIATTITANASAGRSTYLTALAAQKIEDLQASSWDWLDGNTGEFTDQLDRRGVTVEGAPETVVFTRQWTVVPWASDPANTRILDVTVRTGLDEVRMASVRTRMAP